MIVNSYTYSAGYHFMQETSCGEPVRDYYYLISYVSFLVHLVFLKSFPSTQILKKPPPLPPPTPRGPNYNSF